MSLFAPLESLLHEALVALKAGDALAAEPLLDQVQAKCDGSGELSPAERDELVVLHGRCVTAAAALHALVTKDLVQAGAGGTAARAYARAGADRTR